jgi:hypothetical protein
MGSNALTLVAEMLNSSAAFLFHVPGRAWALKANREPKRPYLVVKIDSADTVGRDSKYHFEDRMISMSLYGDAGEASEESLDEIAAWITPRMDSDHEESIDPDGLMELSPVMPWVPEMNEDDQEADVIRLSASFSLKTSRAR